MELIYLIAYIFLIQRPFGDPRQLLAWLVPMSANIFLTILFAACTSGFIFTLGMFFLIAITVYSYCSGVNYQKILEESLEKSRKDNEAIKGTTYLEKIKEILGKAADELEKDSPDEKKDDDKEES